MTHTGQLKVVYAAALVNVGILAIWGFAYDLPGMLGLVAGPAAPTILLAADGFLAVSLLVAAAPLVFLFLRPRGWGKLLLPVYGFAWIMHAAVLYLFMGLQHLHVTALWLPVACGAIMFALALTHQVIDPRFFRSSAIISGA